MKKNILLILMFISMFFIGSNDVEAKLKCEVGDKNCTVDAIQKEIGSEKVLTCLYEVKIDNKEEYYSYIYYDYNADEFYGGTTFKYPTSKGKLASFENNNVLDAILVSDEAYKSLIENGKCPKNNYFVDEHATLKRMCFDNAEECKNNGKPLDNSVYDFNLKTKREGTLKKQYDDTFKYKKLFTAYKNISKNDIPSEYDNICTYRSYNSDYLHILYNSKSTRILYKVREEKKEKNIIIDPNSRSSGGDDKVIYRNYINNLTSCPETIYREFVLGVAGSEDEINFTVERPQSTGATAHTKVITFELYDDSNGNLGEKLDPIDKCSDLIDPNSGLGKIIKIIFKVIGIAVPILLIGLVTFDLATAVFAGDEKAVNSAKSNAIKRVIIAVVIFFVPTLMNFVFSLINEVWDRNFSTCIEELEK